MEKSEYSWVLIGSKGVDGDLSLEKIDELTRNSFNDDSTFQLYLLGNHIEKFGTLEEMEGGLNLVIEEMDEYEEGAYCIISEHEEGQLLFCPVKMEE